MPESTCESEAYQRTCHLKETKYAKLIYMARTLAGMNHRDLAEAFMSEYYPPVASPIRIAGIVDQIINFENASEVPGEEFAYRLIKICLEHARRNARLLSA